MIFNSQAELTDLIPKASRGDLIPPANDEFDVDGAVNEEATKQPRCARRYLVSVQKSEGGKMFRAYNK